MTEHERLKRYDEEIAAEAAKAKKHEAKKKALMKDKAKFERNQRTHRLCTRGARLEQHLRQPLALSDDQLDLFLQDIFRLPAVQERLAAILPSTPLEELAEQSEPDVQEEPEEPAPPPLSKPPDNGGEKRPPSSPYHQNKPYSKKKKRKR